MLEVSTSTEFRAWAMGHAPNSNTYMNYYKSRTATRDIQSIMHGTEAKDVVVFSSIRLGRVKDPPQKLSKSGLGKVMEDPEVSTAQHRVMEALDSLTLKYSTISSARQDKSPLYHTWRQARDAYDAVVRRVKKAEFKREYSEYIAQYQVLQVPGVVGIAELDNLDNIDLELLAEDEDEAMTQLRLQELDLENVDPATLNDVDFVKVSTGRVDDTLESLDASLSSAFNSDEGLDPDMQSGDSASEGATTRRSESITYRRHGVYRDRFQQRCNEGLCSESHVLKAHAFDGIWNLVKESRLSDTELSDKLLPFFATSHALERYGSRAPIPGTFICATCSISYKSKAAFNSHIRNCWYANALDAMTREWEDGVGQKMEAGCTWASTRKKRCGKIFDDHTKFCRHIMEHTRRKVKSVCRFEDCANDHNAAELFTRDEWNEHLANRHGLTTMQPSSLMFYCCFCDDFVLLGIQGSSARARHYEDHLSNALDSLKNFGYMAVKSTVEGAYTLSTRHPFFCVFCVHNANLEPQERIAVCNQEREGYNLDEKTHLAAHFRDLQTASVPIHCPSSTAAGADFPLCSSKFKYTPEELAYHLEQDHCIFIAKGMGSEETEWPGRKRKGSGEQGEGETVIKSRQGGRRIK